MPGFMRRWLRDVRILNLDGGGRRGRRESARRGVIAVLAMMILVMMFGFIAYAIDTGRISMTRTAMQNAVDAAALAASQEIVSAVYAAGAAGQGGVVIDANSTAVANARVIAETVASANGVTIDPSTDVEFGKRNYNASSQTWSIEWGGTPYNTVRVTARRDQPDSSAPNGRFPLSFGWALGISSVEIVTSASSFVESRDIAVVLDYSSSMNDDSTISAFSKLGQANVEANLDQIWSTLVAADPKFKNTTKSKFPSTGYGSVNSAVGTFVSSTDSEVVFTTLGLGATDSSGNLLHPFPMAGKTNGTENGLPSATTSKTRWKAYIDSVKNHSNATYKKKYGYRTLIDYLLRNKYKNSDSEELWRTPHYPFHAMKQGTSLFLDFLDDLDYGDEVGLVVFDAVGRIESTYNEYGYNVNLTSNLITDDYAAVETIQSHKQAAHYSSGTAMGHGIDNGRTLLVNNSRYGSRKIMLLLTDGQTNVRPSGWTLPSGFNWAEWTDYNGDGNADYTTSDANCQYAFYQATEAIKQGIVIHTISVGVGADDNIMKAIAFASGGIWVDVPGGATIETMEEQLLAAFSQIAAKVPPPKLVYDTE